MSGIVPVIAGKTDRKESLRQQSPYAGAVLPESSGKTKDYEKGPAGRLVKQNCL